MTDEPFPRLPPAEAVEYLRGKGYRVGLAWQDVWQEEHARAFTVAKAMSRDVLETIRTAVDQALAKGETLEQFRAQLTPLLQAKGWWGRKPMIDPATGLSRTVQLGSPRRLKIIYEMNMRMAQAAGRWEQIQRTKHMLPYLRYTAVMDERTRPEHAEWHGTILPVDDPWWDTHYPPCGWNCRCTTIQLDAETIADRGWEVSAEPPPAGTPEPWTNGRTGEVLQIPAGIDPGFAYNVGNAWLGGIEPPILPEPLLPDLEPGVIGGEGEAGTSDPPGLLAPEIGAIEAIDAFLGELGDVGETIPAASIVGGELAPLDAPITDVRNAAREAFRAMPPAVSPQLGDVAFTRRGSKKAIAGSAERSGGDRKLRVVPALPQVIATGTARVERNLKQATKEGVTAIARIAAPVELAGQPLDVEVIAEQRAGRWSYYDHRIKTRSDRPRYSGGVSDSKGQSAVGLPDPKPGGRSAFDIGSLPAGVERDRVVVDPSGWPLAVGIGWFRGADGKLAVPAGDRRRVLRLVGRAIAAPDEIRLRWVKGTDGVPMLFRRYIAQVDGLAIVVDVGRAGWRFSTARDAGFDLARLSAGELIWSAKLR